MANIFDRISVLIVDDMRDMRMNLRAILESLHVSKIVEAKSGDEALEQLQRHPVDVVLCDHNMGDGRNGQQTLEEARGRALLKLGAAWIMVTAEQMQEQVLGVVENAPDDYLVKPLGKALLHQRLERAVLRKRTLAPVEAALAAFDFKGAVQACDDLIARAPALRAELLRLKVRALLELEAFDEAADLCFEILTERDYPWALIALGRARLGVGSMRDARRFLGQAVQKQALAMEAYDSLAAIETAAGNHAAAKEILQQALALSPLSVPRQQALGDCASRDGDHAEAEKAYARAVRMGKDSCLARPEDAACLAMATFKHSGPDAAMKVVQEISRRNPRQRVGQSVDWRRLTVQARLAAAMGQQAEAAAALSAALAAYRRDVEHDNAAHSLDLVRCCYELGRGDEARLVVRKLVRENFDRTGQLALIQALFDEMGVGEEGTRIIEEERKSVIKVNKEGVLLAKDGRFEEGLSLLQQAAEELPNNLTVALNVVFATLIQMQRNGVSQQVRFVAHEYLGRAERLAPRSPKVAQLRERLAALEAKKPPIAAAGA